MIRAMSDPFTRDGDLECKMMWERIYSRFMRLFIPALCSIGLECGGGRDDEEEDMRKSEKTVHMDSAY